VEKVKDGVEHSMLFLAADAWSEFVTGTGTSAPERKLVNAPSPIR